MCNKTSNLNNHLDKPMDPKGNIYTYTGRSKSRAHQTKSCYKLVSSVYTCTCVINCIAVNIIVSPTARWHCRSTNEYKRHLSCIGHTMSAV
jgi:hypothetical protein